MDRTTSAGYRLPLGKTTSVHRDAGRQDTVPTPGVKGKSRAIEKCDEVSANKIWREHVQSEWKGVHDWKTNWGFLNDFDPRGRPKTPKQLPEREPIFSDTLPDTQGHVYGSRIESKLGNEMTKMEFMFHSSNRKCRMGPEFVCV